jgi:hypothetical protein
MLDKGVVPAYATLDAERLRDGSVVARPTTGIDVLGGICELAECRWMVHAC